MTLRQWVALTTIFALNGCAMQAVDYPGDKIFLNPGVQQYFEPRVHAPGKALQMPDYGVLIDMPLPLPPDWLHGQAQPFRCGFFRLLDTENIPEADWHLTGWQEYQTYNAVQHIHQDTDPTRRLILLTLSAAD